MKHPDERFDDMSRWLGVTLTPEQREMLVRFERWLSEEAEPAGVIGSGELPRLWDRHIADSLAFVPGISAESRTLVDVGGGIGLPSIPIAIARPDLACTLIDRSAKRTRLAQRAIRVLGITNLHVVHTDIAQVGDTFDVATFRASLRMYEAAVVTKRVVLASGIGLFAVSRRPERPSLPKAPDGISFTLSSEGAVVLDTPFWLLRMQHS